MKIASLIPIHLRPSLLGACIPCRVQVGLLTVEYLAFANTTFDRLSRQPGHLPPRSSTNFSTLLTDRSSNHQLEYPIFHRSINRSKISSMSDGSPFNSRARDQSSAPQRYPTARTPFAIRQLLNPSENQIPVGSARPNEGSNNSWLSNRPSSYAPRSGSNRNTQVDMDEEELVYEAFEDDEDEDLPASQTRRFSFPPLAALSGNSIPG